MSFFSEKVLKRPPAEEIKGYSLREIEIARKNYNYGHNVCFYTVMVCFIIWAILCSVFRPSVAHASELVGGDEPIVTKYDNYVICSSSSGAPSGKYLVLVNGSGSGERIRFDSFGYFSSLEAVASALQNGTFKSGNSGNFMFPFADYDIVEYCSQDFTWSGQSFQKTPYLVHTETRVGGLAAPEIAKAIMIQVLGLVPLVLGLAVSAIGLRKALAMVFQRLRRA